MNLDDRLRSAAADVRALHARRLVPDLRQGSTVPRWLAAAATAVAAITAIIILMPDPEAPPVGPAQTTTSTSQPGASTTVSPSTTSPSTTIPGQDPVGEIAWTEADAQRMVEGYLAALSSGEWTIAAQSMESNGIAPDDAGDDETPTEYLTRSCMDGEVNRCAGPYVVEADGPGVVDRDTAQASSVVTVTNPETGESASIEVTTFEGQPVITDLPPMSSGTPQPLVEQLFGSDTPDVVIGRFGAVERWGGGSAEWSSQPLVDRFSAVAGQVALAFVPGPDTFVLTPISGGSSVAVGSCPALVAVAVYATDECPTDVYDDRGEPIPSDRFEYGGVEAGASFYAERAGVLVSGSSDAEGNLFDLKSGSVDLIGNDYGSLARLSRDGSKIAYVDHGDERAESHFWSPVVVVRDTATGSELHRIAFDSQVLWLEFDGQWVVVGGRTAEYSGLEALQESIGTFDLDSETQREVRSSTRLWLP